MINTKFWSDNFIVNLEPIERYLYLYLLTNEHTNIAGVYELPEKTIIYESDLTKDVLIKSLKKLDGKIFYIDGWVYIKNFAKHQCCNDSMRRAVDNEMKGVPLSILNKIERINNEIELKDNTLWTGCEQVSTCGAQSKGKGKGKELNYITEPGGSVEILPGGTTNGGKKKKISDEDGKLFKEAQELIDYWKKKWEDGNGGKKATITSWARFIKIAKLFIKIHGLERMKMLCDAYFITFDDKLITESGWGLNIFLYDSTINKLSVKY